VSGIAHVEPKLPAAIRGESSEPGGPRQVSVATGYERWAPVYDQDLNPLLAREERHLSPLMGDLEKKRVLDLACGTGRWLSRLMTRGPLSGVGLDRSDAMLRVACRKGAITGRLARAGCESLPFRGGVFDLAICSFAVGHIRDLELMVRELARVTRPAADLFVSDLHPDAYDRGWRVGFRDESCAVHIETFPRHGEEIIRPFCSNGFEYLSQTPLWLEEPEKPIFARAGKSDRFEEACQSPAVLVFHFRRLSLPDGIKEAW
jgi:ubiquinone/menaquinone biosynthesis C-methylase UbiE